VRGTTSTQILAVLAMLLAACDRAPEPAPAPPPAPALAPTPPPAADPEDDVVLVEAITAHLWRVEESDLTQLAVEVAAGEVTCTPQPRGCRLALPGRAQAARRIGAIEGDVVLSVAGVELGDGSTWSAALRAA